MDDLVAFLRARLDEDEAAAGDFHDALECRTYGPVPLPCDCRYPARVLREVEAGRAIVEMHGETHECPSEYDNCGWFEFENGAICPTLRHLAAVYSDHPDYDPAWAVSG